MSGSRELHADWKESERDGGGGKSLSALRGLERPCPGPAAQCWLTVNPPLVPPPLPHTSSDSQDSMRLVEERTSRLWFAITELGHLTVFEAFEEPAACHTAAHTVLSPRIPRHSKVGVNNQISLRAFHGGKNALHPGSFLNLDSAGSCAAITHSAKRRRLALEQGSCHFVTNSVGSHICETTSDYD
ncbi:unnamed protein product [Leuciscus chuanchicus]